MPLGGGIGIDTLRKFDGPFKIFIGDFQLTSFKSSEVYHYT